MESSGRISNQRQFAKSGFLGAVTALSFAPFNVFPIFLATFAWLFVRICEGGNAKEWLLQPFCFFCCLHIGCLYWLVYPLTLDLAVHGILIPFAILLIPIYLSMFLLLPICGLRMLSNWFRKSARLSFYRLLPVAFATFFTLTMMFYGNYLPGFPWVLPGYVWCCHEIFLQTLCLYGIYGLSFSTLLMAGLLGDAFLLYVALPARRRGKAAAWGPVLIAFVIFAAITLFGYWRLARNPTIYTDKRVRIIQSNISQEQKNDSAFAYSNLKKLLRLSAHSKKVDLVIWPEASVPYLYNEDFTRLHNYLKIPLLADEYLLAGAVRKDLQTGKIFNSVIFIDHTGKHVAHYDKARLTPFGEYIPLRKYFPLFQSIASDIGDFNVGSESNLIEIGGIKILLAICYEVIFPGKLGLFSSPDFSKTDIIVNITNDGWFGFTSEPAQHLQISRARAIEAGVPLIRVANVGVSAVFDPCGRELSTVPFGQDGVIEMSIPRSLHLPY